MIVVDDVVGCGFVSLSVCCVMMVNSVDLTFTCVCNLLLLLSRVCVASCVIVFLVWV